MKLLVTGLAILFFAASAQAADQTKLDNQIRELTAKFAAMQQKPDKCIPAETLRKAQGILLLDRTKAGFIFGFQGGKGVSMVKDPKTQQWGPAAFLKAAEVSLGAQVGVQQSFIVILFMTPNAARVLTESNFELGGEARGTGDDASSGVDGTISSHEQAMLVYADRKGLYGGAVVKCGVLAPDPHANLAYYGNALAIQDILFEKQVKATEAALELGRQITDPKAASIAANAPRPARKIKPVQSPRESQSVMAARPARSPAGTRATAAFTSGGTGQLLLLIDDLEANRQTNAIKLLNNYLTVMITTLQTTDADTTVAVLQQLRAGHTREAIEMLESRLDGALIGLGASVGSTPETERQPASLSALQRAREYRTAFPRKTANTNVDSAIKQAWNLPDRQK